MRWCNILAVLRSMIIGKHDTTCISSKAGGENGQSLCWQNYWHKFGWTPLYKPFSERVFASWAPTTVTHTAPIPFVKVAAADVTGFELAEWFVVRQGFRVGEGLIASPRFRNAHVNIVFDQTRLISYHSAHYYLPSIKDCGYEIPVKPGMGLVWFKVTRVRG